MKKILFISCYFNIFTDIDCGASNRSTMFIKALTQIGTVDIVSFTGRRISPNIERCNVVYQDYVSDELPHSNIIKKAYNLFRPIISPKDPYSYYSLIPQKSKIVSEFMKNGEYDYVACRYMFEAASCGLFNYSDKLIIDIDDNLVSSSKQTLNTKKFKNPLLKFIFKLRAYNIGLMSEHILKKVKLSFYSNRLEPSCSKSVYLPNVTSQQYNIPILNEVVPKRLLIVGFLDYYPNKYGVYYFINNVYPLIREQIPNVELHIVGKSNDNEFIDFINNTPGAKALGFIEDISEEYEKCGVIVIPLYHGTGTSVKFVEGLLMNRPIVSTPIGVRGLEYLCENNKHYLLADNDISFSENIIALLKSIDKSKMIAENAYKLGVEYFTSNSFMNIVKKELG